MRQSTTVLLLTIILATFAGVLYADSNYSAYINVYDENSNPLSGVSIRLDVMTATGMGFTDLHMDSDYGVTDGNGYVFLQVSLPGFLIQMDVTMTNNDYSIISSEYTWTRTSNTLFPRFDIGLDINNNEVVDSWEMPLAEKFCPSFKLHSTTDWIAPEPVEYIDADKTSGLWIGLWNGPQKVGDYSVTDEALFNPPLSQQHPWINDPNCDWSTLSWEVTYTYTGHPPGKAYRTYYFKYHFGFSGDPDPSGWSPLYQPERNNNNFEQTIYAHFFTYGSRYIIQYWMFYPYNDNYNNHEGDWEHINVHLDSQNPSNANIIQVDFYFHHKVQVRLNGDFEIEGGSHPVIYVGGECAGINWPANCEPGVTSGGSYPSSGTWNDVGPLGYDEYVWGNGPYINYSEFIDGDPDDRRGIVILPEVDDIDYSSKLHMRWFKADIPWGPWGSDTPYEWTEPVIGDIGNDGPAGPAHNSGWNTIEDENSFSNHNDRP